MKEYEFLFKKIMILCRRLQGSPSPPHHGYEFPPRPPVGGGGGFAKFDVFYSFIWKTHSRGARYKEAPQLAAIRWLSRHPNASLDLGPLDVVFLEAVLAANSLKASKSKTSKRVPDSSRAAKH